MIRDYVKKAIKIKAVLLDGDIETYLEVKSLNKLNRTINIDEKGNILIETLEGVMKANIGDYVIQGINGELYPCKADIFLKTYDYSFDPDEDLIDVNCIIPECIRDIFYKNNSIISIDLGKSILKKAIYNLDEILKKTPENCETYECLNSNILGLITLDKMIENKINSNEGITDLF